MAKKTIAQINSFHLVVNEKFHDSEKIKYALDVKITPQLKGIQKEIELIKAPYSDSLILLGLVHEEGDKKGSLKRDENGNVLYSPQAEIELRNQLIAINNIIEEKEFDIETYFLNESEKPLDFTEIDKYSFDGFIEFESK